LVDISILHSLPCFSELTSVAREDSLRLPPKFFQALREFIGGELVVELLKKEEITAVIDHADREPVLFPAQWTTSIRKNKTS